MSSISSFTWNCTSRAQLPHHMRTVTQGSGNRGQMHTVDLWLCKNNSCYDWNDFLTYKTRLNMERFDRFSINFYMKISVLLYIFLRYAQFPYSIMRACVCARALFIHYFLLHFAIGLSDQSIKCIFLRDVIIQDFLILSVVDLISSGY